MEPVGQRNIVINKPSNNRVFCVSTLFVFICSLQVRGRVLQHTDRLRRGVQFWQGTQRVWAPWQRLPGPLCHLFDPESPPAATAAAAALSTATSARLWPPAPHASALPAAAASAATGAAAAPATPGSPAAPATATQQHLPADVHHQRDIPHEHGSFALCLLWAVLLPQGQAETHPHHREQAEQLPHLWGGSWRQAVLADILAVRQREAAAAAAQLQHRQGKCPLQGAKHGSGQEPAESPGSRRLLDVLQRSGGLGLWWFPLPDGHADVARGRARAVPHGGWGSGRHGTTVRQGGRAAASTAAAAADSPGSTASGGRSPAVLAESEHAEQSEERPGMHQGTQRVDLRSGKRGQRTEPPQQLGQRHQQPASWPQCLTFAPWFILGPVSVQIPVAVAVPEWSAVPGTTLRSGSAGITRLVRTLQQRWSGELWVAWLGRVFGGECAEGKILRKKGYTH